MKSNDDVTVSSRTEQLLRFDHEHDVLRGALTLMRDPCRATDLRHHTEALEALREAHRYLPDRLLPAFARSEEAELYPALGEALGSSEGTAPMSRAHAEIERLRRRLTVHLASADSADGLSSDQTDDLLACLYGLYGVLRLHFRRGGGELLRLVTHPERNLL